MKKNLILILGVVAITGCSTVRKSIDFVDKGIEAVVSVKDPVLNTARKVVDVSEGLKNDVTGGAKETATTATQ